MKFKNLIFVLLMSFVFLPVMLLGIQVASDEGIHKTEKSIEIVNDVQSGAGEAVILASCIVPETLLLTNNYDLFESGRGEDGQAEFARVKLNLLSEDQRKENVHLYSRVTISSSCHCEAVTGSGGWTFLSCSEPMDADPLKFI